MSGVTVPLHACEHMYIVTNPMDGVTPDLPVMRDADGHIYFKEEVAGLLMGGFDPWAKPWGMDGIPEGFSFGTLPEDWDKFEPLMRNADRARPRPRLRPGAPAHERAGELHARQLLPPGRGAGGPALLRRRRLLLGRHRRGGRRRARARRVDRRGPAADGSLAGRHPPLRALSRQPGVPARAGERDRGRALLRGLSQPRAPDRPRTAPLAAPRAPARAARLLRQQDGLGARELVRARGVAPETAYSFGRQNWFPYVAAEHRACREAVAVFDQTLVLQVPARGSGCRERAPAALRQRRRGGARAHGLHRHAQRARRLRERPDRHAARVEDAYLDRHRLGADDARRALDPASHARRRARHPHRRRRAPTRCWA